MTVFRLSLRRFPNACLTVQQRCPELLSVTPRPLDKFILLHHVYRRTCLHDLRVGHNSTGRTGLLPSTMGENQPSYHTLYQS